LRANSRENVGPARFALWVPHFVVFAVYVAFVVGHLNVMGLSVTKLFDTSQKPNPGDYIAVINRDALKNADVAMSWAFNIPRQGFGQPQSLTAGMLGYLKVFRAAVLLLIASGLVTKFQRGVLVFGMAWFWITVAPALPLVSHFLPYYVFSSMIGLALVVGVIFTKLFDQLARVHPLAASACIVSILAGVLYATAPVIRTDIRDNDLLGGSSTLAWNTLNDLRSFHPQLPRDSKLYFADAVQPLSWPHHYGALIKMAYGMDALSILYESNGDRLSPVTTNVLVFGVHDRHLTNETGRITPIRNHI
jgi:hypothetical protein